MKPYFQGSRLSGLGQINGSLNSNFFICIIFIVVVQSLSHVQLFVTHGLQHARPLCFSLSPGVCSNSYLPSLWWHLTISSSASLFSFCFQPFPALGPFPMSQLFVSVGQIIGTSASASVIPMNIRGWFLEDWLDWSPYCPKDSQESSPAPQFESIISLALSLCYDPVLTSVHTNTCLIGWLWGLRDIKFPFRGKHLKCPSSLPLQAESSITIKDFLTKTVPSTDLKF